MDAETEAIFKQLREIIDEQVGVPDAQVMKRLVTNLEHVLDNRSSTIEELTLKLQSRNYI